MDFSTTIRKKIVLFDIDWVLAKMREDYSFTHDGSEDVIHINKLLLSLLSLHSKETMVEVVLLTWREESTREVTVNWLSRYGIEYSKLIMKLTPKWNNAAFKSETIRSLSFESDILLVVDDNPAVLDICKSMRIPFCLFFNN